MPRSAPMPTFEEVLELPAQLEREVGEDLIDLNGHMNIRHYLSMGAHSSAGLLVDAGLTATYRKTESRGVFTAEHHLTYLAEVRVGDHVSAHARLLGRSAKAAHIASLLLNRSRHELSYALEAILLHMDLTSRRAIAFPDDMSQHLDGLLREHQSLDWTMPVYGSTRADSTS
jgi:acyl-CoA thioester hydrolase